MPPKHNQIVMPKKETGSYSPSPKTYFMKKNVFKHY